MTRWDALFADLEAQAAAVAFAQRVGEAEDRARMEVARISVHDRVRPQRGSVIRVQCGAAGSVRGRLVSAGAGWLLVEETGGREAIVVLEAAATIGPLGRLSGSPEARGSVESRLGLTHVVRGLIRDRSSLRVHLRDGEVLGGTPDRLGADFVEIAIHPVGELRRRDAVVETVAVRLVAIAVLRRDIG